MGKECCSKLSLKPQVGRQFLHWRIQSINTSVRGVRLAASWHPPSPWVGFHEERILKGWKGVEIREWQTAKHLPPTHTIVQPSYNGERSTQRPKKLFPNKAVLFSAQGWNRRQCREVVIWEKKLGWRYPLATEDLQLWEDDEACWETASQWWAPAAVAVSWCCPQVALQTAHMLKGPEATN